MAIKKTSDKRITEYTKKDGTYAYKFHLYIGRDPLTGKQIQTTRRGFKTIKQAKIAMARLEIEMNDRGFLKNERTTFEDVYNEYFPQYKNTVKESTWVKTQQMYKNHVIPIFGKKILSKITPQQCQQAINKWYEDGFTKYKDFFRLISSVFQYAIRLGLVHDDPTKRVIVPKNKHVKDMTLNYFTVDELRTFFKYLDSDKYPKRAMFFRVLAFTGMRKGEALALTWNDIDFKNNQISINKTIARGEDARLIVQTPKTRASKRVVNLDDKTMADLKKWCSIQAKELLMLGFNVLKNKDQLVFSNTNNEFIQPVKPQNWLYKIIKKYDLKRITVHGFRHTYATLAFEAGASIKEVQEQLGHSDFQTTMNIYTAVTDKQKLETTEKFAKYVNF